MSQSWIGYWEFFMTLFTGQERQRRLKYIWIVNISIIHLNEDKGKKSVNLVRRQVDVLSFKILKKYIYIYKTLRFLRLCFSLALSFPPELSISVWQMQAFSMTIATKRDYEPKYPKWQRYTRMYTYSITKSHKIGAIRCRQLCDKCTFPSC